jgi:hypothetical protein
MKKQVLFVTYGGGHAQMVTPVVAALGNQVDVTVLGLPAALAHLNAAGIRPITFADLVDPSRDNQAVAWGEDLAGKHHSDHSGIARQQSVAYLGLSFADLVARRGLNAAQALIKSHGRNAFFPISMLERTLDRVKPDMVVATSSPRAEAAALEVARSRGLHSLAMIDLFSGVEGYVIPAKDATFLTQMAADLCEAQGFYIPQKTTAHILGNPAFDRLLTRQAKPDPEWIAARFSLAQGQPIVLHADMPAWLDSRDGKTHTKTEAEVWAEMVAVHSACHASGAAYAVRPHPSQGRALFSKFVAEHPGTSLADGPDLHDLIERVDLVIARSTTVALEAVYLRQRVLQLEPQRHRDMPLLQMGVAAGCDDVSTLASALRSCLEDHKAHATRMSKLQDVLPQRPAAEAIADLILTLLHVGSEPNETAK